MSLEPIDFDPDQELDRRIPVRRGLTPPKSKGPAAPHSSAPRHTNKSGLHKRRRRHYGL